MSSNDRKDCGDGGTLGGPLRLKALNHVTLVVKDVKCSVNFWTGVVGFRLVRRPSRFDFTGAWLWRDGLAIHLIEGSPAARSRIINPLSDHISFIADEPLKDVAERLTSMGIEYKEQIVQECGIVLRQIFFHDPDNTMIEICNCDTFPIEPVDLSDSNENNSCGVFLLNDCVDQKFLNLS